VACGLNARCRGDRRVAPFFSPSRHIRRIPDNRNDGEDRQEFLRLLGDGVEQFRYSVRAYCLIGNHFHQEVRTGKTPLLVLPFATFMG